MTSQGRLTVLLHLDPASEPISGRMETPGQSSEFVGWLGLASVLERALDGEGGTSPGDGSESVTPAPRGDP